MIRFLFRTGLSILACGEMAACAAGPGYTRPSAPVSTTFKEDAGWAVARPGDMLERGDWWTLFDDPTLNELERRVRVSNQNIAAAEAAYRQARALVSEQRAGLFPAVDLSAGATRSGSGRGSGTVVVNPDGATTTTGGGRAQTAYRASLGASWEPDVWGRVRRTVEAAGDQAEASAADLAAVRLSMQGEVAVNYFGLRAADADVALAEATAAGYRRTHRITRNRYDAGIVPRSDVLQAETQLNSALADLAVARQQRQTYEHAVAVLVGEAPGNFSLPPGEWNQAAPEIPPGIPSLLLQRRPDIAAAERRMAAANARIGVAASAFFPSLNLTGAYGFAGSGQGALFSASNAVWSLGAAASGALLDFGARSARVRGARAGYDQTVAQYRQTVLTALQEVENQLIANRTLAAQHALRRDASVAADTAERMVDNRYQAGQVSYLELFTAQNSAYAARRTLVQAAVQRQAAAVALIQALGGGWRAP